MVTLTKDNVNELYETHLEVLHDCYYHVPSSPIKPFIEEHTHAEGNDLIINMVPSEEEELDLYGVAGKDYDIPF